MGDISLGKLSSSWKVLITGVVLTLCLGYLAAVANAALSVGISVDAIADHYGDKTVSSFDQAALDQHGFVEEEFSLDDMGMSDMDHSSMIHDMHQGQGLSQGDDTLPSQILAQVSHVHLLFFSLLLMVLGDLT